MAPLRRYLRITRHSVLEVRIYLDNPSDVHRWLLQPSSIALPRIIAAVQPLVLPKLQEESDVKAKNKKAKGWKDTVSGEDFEVSVFLTEGGCGHAIMSREKRIKGEKKAGGAGRSVGGKMTGGTSSEPVEIGGEDVAEGDGGSVTLADIPLAAVNEEGSEALFVSDDEEGERGESPDEKKTAGAGSGDTNDKKKLAFATTYDGFSIYGRILCLVVKRKGGPIKDKEQSRGAGQARMEQWISSTQMPDGPVIYD